MQVLFSKNDKNGVVTKNELINCEISDYKKNYKKIDTSVFIKNENLILS